MAELVPPTVEVHRSFVAAIHEFHAHPEPPPWFVADLDPEILADPAMFALYAEGRLEERFEETPRPPGFVPATTLWWVEGREFLGRLAIRHRLTPVLEEFGGHIGYDVRPSARRRGHATAMLGAALPIAYGLGIDPALIMCEHTNVASRRIIERHGGAFVDRRAEKLRFLLRTAPPRASDAGGGRIRE